jgi:hypothetical protein
VAILIAYFVHFALPALHGGFRDDEMLNMAIYWHAGMPKCLLANLTFWTTFYRPAGALYYLPLYHFFGLDPLPYRLVQIVILGATIPVLFYLSRLLTSSRLVAFLAVLGACYHPRLLDLVFVGAFIYDVLCGFFYFAALTYYVHIRERGACLRPMQVIIFLGLYICALNCKEMAVTLPLIVLIYELLKSPRWTSWKEFVRWVWSSASPSLVAGVLTAVYLYGKTHGPGSLVRLDPYRPRISWHQFTYTNTKFVGELLFGGHPITPITLFALWALVAVFAFLRRDRTVRLMAFWIVIVPLPIAFLTPVRANASLYLLLFGWAMILASIVVDVITIISKSWVFARQDSGIGGANGAIIRSADSPRVRRAGGQRSPGIFQLAATIFVAFTFAIFMHWRSQRDTTAQNLLTLEQKVPHVINALRSLNLQPTHGSAILLKMKDNPFNNKWHPVCIAWLVWNDASLQVWADDIGPLTPQQLASINYVISLGEFHAQVIRSPQAQ